MNTSIENGEIIIYQPDNVSMMLEVRIEDETVWLTQAQMSELFQTTRNNITLHITNIFKEKELEEETVCKDSLLTAKDGKKYKTNLLPTESIFFEGQIFDAYQFASDIIKSAKKSIVLIDNYVDESVLTMLSKRNSEVTATIYTASISKQLTLDLKRFNAQYPKVEVKTFTKSHDRFLIVDHATVYHIGASLKDLGKKWFAFSKIELDAMELINKLNSVDHTKP